VVVDRRRVRYRAAGSGKPLVLVHGLGVSADYWVRNASVIAAAGFRVLAPDLPGFGRTSGPAGGLDVVAQAEALRQWAVKLEIGPAAYLGHSLSCQAILELAVRYPEAVRGLILAAPTGEGASLQRLAKQAFGLMRDLARESPKLAGIVALAYLQAGPLRVLGTWRKGADHHPMPLLPQIRVPSLVIVGERDPVVDLPFAESIAAALPGGRVVVVPDGSHGVIFDPTGLFNETVIDFLRKLESSPTP
jgi:pimeloyl-ACP methyl ester carboxylesterase